MYTQHVYRYGTVLYLYPPGCTCMFLFFSSFQKKTGTCTCTTCALLPGQFDGSAGRRFTIHVPGHFSNVLYFTSYLPARPVCFIHFCVCSRHFSNSELEMLLVLWNWTELPLLLLLWGLSKLRITRWYTRCSSCSPSSRMRFFARAFDLLLDLLTAVAAAARP